MIEIYTPAIKILSTLTLLSLPLIFGIIDIGRDKFKEKFTYERVFPSKDIDIINCSTFNGDVEIIGEGEEEIKFIAIIYSRKPLKEDIVDKYIEITEKGFELNINTKDHIWNRIRIGAVDYKLKVPHLMSVFSTTSNGDMSAQNVNGGLTLKTSNGDICVKEAKGEVMTKSSNGDVIIDDSTIAKVRTANGDIKLNKIEQFMLETANGDISVDSDIISDNSNASTARGDITLHTNEFSSAELSTVMGNISIQGFESDKDDRKTTIGGETKTIKADGSYHLDARTSMGDITLEKM